MWFMKCRFSPSPGSVRHCFVCAGWVLSCAPVSCVWVDAQRQPAAVRAQLRCGVLLLLLLHAREHLWQTGGRKPADAHHVLRKAALGSRCLNTRDGQRALRTCSGHFSEKDFICLRCLNYFYMVDQKPFRRYFNEGPDTRPVNQLLFQGVFLSSLLFKTILFDWIINRMVTASAVQHTLCTDCSGLCVCVCVWQCPILFDGSSASSSAWALTNTPTYMHSSQICRTTSLFFNISNNLFSYLG